MEWVRERGETVCVCVCMHDRVDEDTPFLWLHNGLGCDWEHHTLFPQKPHEKKMRYLC